MEDSPASKDIEFNKSSVTPNDDVLPQNDDVIISGPSTSTLSVDQSSGTVEIDLDTSKSGHFFNEDSDVKTSGAVKEDVVSQIDDLVIAFSTSFTLSDDPCSGHGKESSFGQLGTVEAGVDKLTSGHAESDMEDVGVKSSSSCDDSVLSQSDDTQVVTSFEQSETVETSVDKLISGQTEETAVEDIKVKSFCAANDDILSQSDDLKVDKTFEQLGTTETGVDETTSGQIEETAMEDIEAKSSGSANDNILSQSDELRVDTEQLGTIETGVDKSTSGQIEESAVDTVVKRFGSANDCVLSERDDLQVGTSFELLRMVAIDLDKLTIGQIEESAVEVIDAKRSRSDTDSDLCQSDGLQIDSSFEQSGPAETYADKLTSEHKQNTLKDIEGKRSDTTNDCVLTKSDDLQIDASPELSGTVEIDVDKSTSEHIKESAVKNIEVKRSGTVNDVVLSQNEELQIDASLEQLGTIEIDVDKSTSGQIEESVVKDIGVKISGASIHGLYQSNDLLIDPSLEQLGTVEVDVNNSTSAQADEDDVNDAEVKRSSATDAVMLPQSDDLLIAVSTSSVLANVHYSGPGNGTCFEYLGTVNTDADKSINDQLEESDMKDIEVTRPGAVNDSVLSPNDDLITVSSAFILTGDCSSASKVDHESGKRLKPVARFKDNGSKVPQPKITRVNSTSTLTKRALSTNVAKKDHDILKQAHVTQKGTKAAKTTQGPKVTEVIGPRRGVPKPLPSSKPSSLGSKTEPTRPSSSCSNSSSCSSGADVKTSVDLSRKKVEPKTGKLTARSVPQTSSRIITKTKAPAPANSRLPSRFVSSKLSSRIPSASSASECSSKSSSSTSTINRKSTPRDSTDTLVSYRSSVESASSIHSTDQNSNQNGNQAVVVPPSQSGALSRPPSVQPTGLRMPSPKIGFFDGGKLGVRTPTGAIQSQSGLPTGPTNSNGVKDVNLPQSKTASAHTTMKQNKQSNFGNKLSCKTNTLGNDQLTISNSSSEVRSLVAGKVNKVDKSVTESSRAPFAVKNSIYDK
uniref:uncharacterized protein LOC122580920 isoform X2 n=1 Tax=Erigeron canadensis TaxID=72917 RepID=UPI001CB96F67|nr:uncharacterized protein LOC122580920 isoform X2 [Erigeron canadensis]